MKVITIAAHPNLEISRVHKTWLAANKADGRSEIRDLYSLYPEGTPIDIEKEQKLLLNADRIVFEFPFQWYSAPHLLKKYIDDVFTYNYAFGTKAVLKGRELLIATSAGSPELAYQPGAHNQYPVSLLLLPYQQSANLCGLPYLTPFVFYGVNGASDEQIKESAARFVSYIHD